MFRETPIAQKDIEAARLTIIAGKGRRLVQLCGRTARTEAEFDALVLSLARSGQILGIDAAKVEAFVREVGNAHCLKRIHVQDEALQSEEGTHQAQRSCADMRAELSSDSNALLQEEQVVIVGAVEAAIQEGRVSIIPAPPGPVISISFNAATMTEEDFNRLREELEQWEPEVLLEALSTLSGMAEHRVEWADANSDNTGLVRDNYLGPWRQPTEEESAAHVTVVTKQDDAVASYALSEDFPGRKALTEAGIATVGDLTGKTVEQLQEIKGIGKAIATQIVERIAPTAQE